MPLMPKKLLGEIKKVSFYNWLIVLLLAFASFIRVFRINTILGFWYDQGRDALVIWDLIHSHKFFLIGPTTGLAGVFRGPWYYYLIAPFYWLGNGQPAVPAAFLSLSTVLAIYIIFRLAEKHLGRISAFLFVLVSSLSLYFLGASRWLSNPTPMFLISALYLLGISKILENKDWGWYAVAISGGMAMQFGSAAEVFYIPAAILFAIFCRKYFPKLSVIVVSAVIFIAPFIPQFLFDLRHGWIITKAVAANFFGGASQSKTNLGNFLLQRAGLYYNIFASKIFTNKVIYVWPFLIAGLYGFFRKWKEISKNSFFIALLILVLSPFVGLLAFRGNYGNLYDYYFTGYYFPMVLLFSYLLASVPAKILRNITVTIFVGAFIYFNLPSDINYIRTNADSHDAVFLGNQETAIDYIYDDAGDSQFNVDEYVPPVIPYSYEYLFKWLGSTKYHKLPDTTNVKLLYTLEEEDPDHPDRIAAWYSRQEQIGKIDKQVQFGPITVERRTRNEKE